MDQNKIQLFEDQPIRTAWDEKSEEWYFSIVDVVGVLTDQGDYQKARKYWNKLKERLYSEGSQLVTNYHQLKMTAKDGKKRLTDVATTEHFYISSSPFPRKRRSLLSCGLLKWGVSVSKKQSIRKCLLIGHWKHIRGLAILRIGLTSAYRQFAPEKN